MSRHPFIVLAGLGLVVSCANEGETKAPAPRAVTLESHDPFFPVAVGVHAGISCEVCHGGFDSFTEFQCTSCHNHAQGVMDTAHAGKPGAERYAFSPTGCYACHPRGTRAVFDHSKRFPIEAGAVHASVSCGACHRDPVDRKSYDCTSCHARTQTANLGSNMDLRHQAVGDYVHQSKSCYGCHPDAKVFSSVDHAPFFPIAPGTRHAGISCGTCHVDASNRKVFDCLSCHTDPTTSPGHAGVPGYLWESASCYACHPQANVNGVINHAPYFPIAAGSKHQNLTCASCHTDPSDRKVLTCTTVCHPSGAMGTAHAAVGGYQYGSTLCLRCHADSQVNRVAQHLPFGITSTFKHHKTSCVGCHNTFRSDKPWGADFRPAVMTCGPCHPKANMDNRHAGRPGYQYVPTTCILSGCHRDGRK